MDRYELRREDYSLSADQLDLQNAYAKFFETHATQEVLGRAEAEGFDRSLWERLCATGATTMALPEDLDGDGATLVDLTIIAEEIGRTLAPVPWIDHVCASRLLGRLVTQGAPIDDFGAISSGRTILGFDPHLGDTRGPRLVPAGAIADHILVREGDDIVSLLFAEKPDFVENIGKLPMAWIDPFDATERTVLASGPAAVAAFDQALDEWRILTASALVGLVDKTMRIAAEFSTTRYTLGVPISSLQGISHPLANIAVAVEGGRALSRKAAWYLDNEPDNRRELGGAAFFFMTEEASRAATMAVQVQGGLGVSTEAAATSYLVRARGWSLAGGDPAETARHIATIVAENRTADSGTNLVAV
ncbi:acyl-CoA dehydrogenase family protein [Rhodococcus artemisiae]|uniref:Acyl-CoA dehydrogenase n=1 Tax=Rhodococcus artemisiae TaxID=714159 RepID=A0ABU7LAE9_9NOCA|nr:acyl-CoA dehydrogenase [Rhodococcus artemisiae]MEE2058533.1 acyl-CoA dehydrogenase [Rhodococcus artemisiae]